MGNTPAPYQASVGCGRGPLLGQIDIDATCEARLRIGLCPRGRVTFSGYGLYGVDGAVAAEWDVCAADAKTQSAPPHGVLCPIVLAHDGTHPLVLMSALFWL